MITRSPVPALPAQTKAALIVDDFSSVRFYHNKVLKSAGFECSSARNGREALELLQRQAFELIVLDLIMPEMGGPEFIRTLRASSAWAHLPVIIISTEMVGKRLRQERTAEAGPVGFVQKPVYPKEIMSEIQRLLLPAGC
ncbi:MAG: response regulator [Opitutae bacterium]|nr:response regulator [Opitutae bacterium]